MRVSAYYNRAIRLKNKLALSVNIQIRVELRV